MKTETTTLQREDKPDALTKQVLDLISQVESLIYVSKLVLQALADETDIQITVKSSADGKIH